MKNKTKNTVIVTFAITLILIMLVGATFAYFTAQVGGTTSRNVSVTSNTTDNLVFQISNDITFTVTQADFYQDAGNRDGYATGTAILTPNNYTGSATDHYYFYLQLDSNPTVYSEENTNEDAELLLQLFDSNNQQVTLTGLGNQVIVEDGLGNNITGYDITGVTGVKTLLSNQTISASNNQATTQTWKVVITLVNYDFNQNDNTGKTITGRLIMQKEEMNLGFTGTVYSYPSSNSFASRIGVNYINGGEVEGVQYTGIYGIINDVNTVRAASSNYLKINVVNDIIDSAEVCLYYNNNEFCVEPGYWEIDDSVTAWCIFDSEIDYNEECFSDEASCTQLKNSTYTSSNYSCREMIPKSSQTNSLATKNKLQTDLENFLGVPPTSCRVYDYEVNCNYPNLKSIFIYSHGGVGVAENYWCEVNSKGVISTGVVT